MINFLTKKQLEKLPTKRLLNYKRTYFNHNPYLHCGLCSGPCEENKIRYAEQIKRWEADYKIIKDILNTREHIER